ncbi:sugar phosphate isomerase/epimerase family protein [Pseudomonas graminis]
MKKALHGVSVLHSNAVTQLRIAHETGFDALVLLPEHLFRYLEHGGTLEKYKQLMQQYQIEISCINALKRIGRHQPQERREMLDEADKICRAAQALSCPVVQVMALNEIDDLSAEDRTRILTENIRDIAAIGAQYGIKFQIEVVAFTPFNSLKQGLEIIQAVGADNVGVVVDFWHLYAGGDTTPEEVAAMDVNLIYGVHFCDGRRLHPGEAWDELVQRNYQPGEGEVDIARWVAAVKQSGYNGVWCPELLSPTHWEDDLWQIAQDSMSSLTAYTQDI